MAWSPQQELALKSVNRWFVGETKRKKIFRLFGPAGTGKTYLAKSFAEQIDGDVVYCAFTGKASDVLRKYGCHGATTIHSLIYTPDVDKKTGIVTFRLNRDSPVKDAALIIIDECSMVNEELAKDLLSFGKPILVLGDPFQLPPVEGAGYFTNAEPDFMLTEIHRQAKDNPIIHLATMIRNHELPSLGNYGESRVIDKIGTEDLVNCDQVLVGRHVTREMVNKKVRKIKEFDEDLPMPGEKLICLKNDRDLYIYNGSMFEVLKTIPPKKFSKFFEMHLDHDDGSRAAVKVKVHMSFFDDAVAAPGKKDWKMLKGTQEFDFGYGVTVHKAQGSQWDHNLVWDESYCFRDASYRWLYTAVTRSSEKVDIYRK